MPRPNRLGLFGVIHMDHPETVTDDLESFAAPAEAIFLEADSLTTGEYLRAALRAPLLLFGGVFLQLLVQGPLFLAFNRDVVSTEVVAIERLADDRPVHAVDETPLRTTLDVGPGLVVANWLVFAALARWSPAAVAATGVLALAAVLSSNAVRGRGRRLPAVALLVAGILGQGLLLAVGLLSVALVLAGWVAFLALVVRTIGRRNRVMLDRVEALSAEHDYEDVVLVTGRDHLGGLARLADDRALSVAAVYLPTWRKSGEIRTRVLPDELPESGRTVDDSPDYPAVVPDSERSVLGRRVAAACVDAVILPPLALLAVVPVGLVYEVATGTGSEGVALPLVAVSGVLAAVCYHAVLESRYGATAGKRVAGLAVATPDGERPTTRQVIVRNLLRPVDLLGLYALGAAAMAATDRRQRLGDVVAGTVVAAVDRDGPDWRTVPTIEPGSERPAVSLRSIAALFDGCLAALVVLGLGFVAQVVLEVQPWVTGVNAGGYADRFALAITVPVLVGYHATLEYRFGTTPGKRVCGAQVVADADGGRLTGRQVLVRNLLRPVDALGGYLLGAAVMLWSDRHQRLGDVVAGTVVGTRGGEATVDDRPSETESVVERQVLAPASERAAVGKRVAATLVDSLVAFCAGFAVLVAIAFGYALVGASFVDSSNWVFLGFFVGGLGYFAFCEDAFGTTIGKHLFGLVVADGDGGPASGRQVLVRTLLRPLEAVFWYLPSFVAMAVTDRYQRVGDVAAGTVVGVRHRPGSGDTPADDEPEPADDEPEPADDETNGSSADESEPADAEPDGSSADESASDTEPKTVPDGDGRSNPRRPT